jgi:hypothetical protein
MGNRKSAAWYINNLIQKKERKKKKPSTGHGSHIRLAADSEAV